MDEDNKIVDIESETKKQKDFLLEVNQLEVSFFTHAGEVKAVNGISYKLRRGEIMGIVGESGSGKSVEAYSIMGLLQPPGRVVAGEILFNGENLLNCTAKQMENLRGNQISIIFQNPMTSLNPVYTIGNQIEEVLRSHHLVETKAEAKEKTIEMLTKVGINNPEQRIQQYPHELSGGMRQRIMIAMGMISDPQLLIADEPTTALDVTIQAQILDLMKNLQKEKGTSIIFITHNLGVVADICDFVSVMYAGHIVEQASVDDIFYNPQHPYTKGLLRSMPRVDAKKHERLIPIEGSPVDMLNPPKGCAFAPRCDQAMDICLKQDPPAFVVGENHIASCWLHAKEIVEATGAINVTEFIKKEEVIINE